MELVKITEIQSNIQNDNGPLLFRMSPYCSNSPGKHFNYCICIYNYKGK